MVSLVAPPPALVDDASTRQNVLQHHGKLHCVKASFPLPGLFLRLARRLVENDFWGAWGCFSRGSHNSWGPHRSMFRRCSFLAVRGIIGWQSGFPVQTVRLLNICVMTGVICCVKPRHRFATLACSHSKTMKRLRETGLGENHLVDKTLTTAARTHTPQTQRAPPRYIATCTRQYNQQTVYSKSHTPKHWTPSSKCWASPLQGGCQLIQLGVP